MPAIPELMFWEKYGMCIKCKNSMGHVWNTGKYQIVHMDLGRRLITFIEKETVQQRIL
ncbi:hypothetical protein PAEAM_63090 [Paenibacillus sp. GM1FR]|nr:hypothetical protein PAEAM_63090 [Paenibacillus sp. GM1FR]